MKKFAGGTPLVSIILPAYNAGAYIQASVNSIITQDYENLELIIINDGSTDQTSLIIDDYAANDPRIRVVHQENQGLIATLNAGLSMARGVYVARMDADDIALPRRITSQVKVLERDPLCDVVGSSIELIDENGTTVGYKTAPASTLDIACHILLNSPIFHPTAMMRRETVGRYSEHDYLAEDYGLWLRMYNGTNITNIDEKLLQYRIHSGSVSRQNVSAQFLKASELRFKYFPFEGVSKIIKITRAQQLALFGNGSSYAQILVAGLSLWTRNNGIVPMRYVARYIRAAMKLRRMREL